jgi:phosphohistidine phosphatase
MELYLIRHADAVPVGDNGIANDADRPLTDLGRNQAKALAKALQKQGIHLDKLLTSPLLRARQTAEEIVSSWVGPQPAIEECEPLEPGGKAKKLAKFVRDLEVNAVGLVGHQPDLSEHVAWLIGSKRAHIDLEKAGVAAIRCGEARKGGGMLAWLITPQWFGAPSPIETATR